MDNLSKGFEVASVSGKAPQVHVNNSSRGHYRGTNKAYKSALRPAPAKTPVKPLLPVSFLAFKYAPLAPEAGNIRLVTLHPRSEDASEIRCTLEHVSLSSSPAYCALSYTWGALDTIFPIVLNGQHFSVTANLAVALLHLRHTNESLVLWIDSLSINQSDNAEKMSQVSQMASIYRSAAVVLAWLGPEDSESEKAILKLDDLSCRYKEMLLRLEASKENVTPLMRGIAGLVERLVIGYEEDCDVPISMVLSLLKREYWTRVWIQQEMALAREIMFVCGSTDIDKQHLVPALEVVMFCTALRSRGSLISKANHWDLVTLGAYIPEFFISDNDFKHPRSLTELLMKLRTGRGSRLAASDPRDYIYGFLDLAEKESPFGITPDYTKDTAQLYTELSQAIFKSGDVDVLRCAGRPLGVCHRESAAMVVDWSLGQRVPMIISLNPQGGTRFLSASGSSSSSCTFPSKGTMRLSGVQVDLVQTVGPTWEYQTDLNESVRQKFASYVEELENLYDEEDEYGFESTWRVPIIDVEGISSTSFGVSQQVVRRATEELSLAGYSALVGYDGLLEDLSAVERDQAYSYLHLMNDHANSRPVFVKKGGLIGLASAKSLDVVSKDSRLGVGDTKEIEPGDFLCVFLGASIPFILR